MKAEFSSEFIYSFNVYLMTQSASQDYLASVSTETLQIIQSYTVAIGPENSKFCAYLY
jgi:hypothetical protein